MRLITAVDGEEGLAIGELCEPALQCGDPDHECMDSFVGMASRRWIDTGVVTDVEITPGELYQLVKDIYGSTDWVQETDEPDVTLARMVDVLIENGRRFDVGTKVWIDDFIIIEADDE